MSFIKDLLSKLGSLLGAFFSGFFIGRAKEQNKALEKQNEANVKKNEIHNRIDTDAAYRKRIRELFKSK